MSTAPVTIPRPDMRGKHEAVKHYPSMEDAWLDLKDLLDAGMKVKSLTTKEVISGAIECLHRANAEHSEFTQDYLARRQGRRDRTLRLKAAGLCVHCGKPVEPGYAMCNRCREQVRAYTERRNQIGREAAG